MGNQHCSFSAVDGAVGGAAVDAVDAGAIDEDLFEDEDLDELEEDINDLNV